MKKWLKYCLLIILGIIICLLGFYGWAWKKITDQISTVYNFSNEAISVSNNTTTINEGKRIAVVRGCNECHGDQLQGNIMASDPTLGTLVAPNLTTGRGGIGKDYTTDNLLMALRHGVNKKGHPLIMMPSQETAKLSKKDMAALIAYIQQLPPIDNELPKNKLGPLAIVMGYLEKFPLTSVTKINHDAPLTVVRFSAGSIEQRKYISTTCESCHRPNMKGGEPLAPGSPQVPDLTSTGTTGKITEEAFSKILRTGLKPDGRQLKNEEMPWKMSASLTDEEIKALYNYLRTI